MLSNNIFIASFLQISKIFTSAAISGVVSMLHQFIQCLEQNSTGTSFSSAPSGKYLLTYVAVSRLRIKSNSDISGALPYFNISSRFWCIYLSVLASSVHFFAIVIPSLRWLTMPVVAQWYVVCHAFCNSLFAFFCCV